MTPRFAIIERQVFRTHISGPYDSAEAARAAVKGLQVVDAQSGALVVYEVVELVPLADEPVEPGYPHAVTRNIAPGCQFCVRPIGGEPP